MGQLTIKCVTCCKKYSDPCTGIHSPEGNELLLVDIIKFIAKHNGHNIEIENVEGWI